MEQEEALMGVPTLSGAGWDSNNVCVQEAVGTSRWGALMVGRE